MNKLLSLAIISTSFLTLSSNSCNKSTSNLDQSNVGKRAACSEQFVSENDIENTWISSTVEQELKTPHRVTLSSNTFTYTLTDVIKVYSNNHNGYFYYFSHKFNDLSFVNSKQVLEYGTFVEIYDCEGNKLDAAHTYQASKFNEDIKDVLIMLQDFNYNNQNTILGIADANWSI